MQSSQPPKFAIIADAHLHDIHADYDGAKITLATQQLTLRSWTDTRASSRVFNESRHALSTALNNIVESGIKIVILLGDYSDDGQIEAAHRLRQLLIQFEEQHGISFFAIPGNHDFYGPSGKHQSTRFSISSEHSVLVTSDPSVASTEPDSAVLTKKMYCPGAPEGLYPMAQFGLTRKSNYLLWETPFGSDDSMESRQYEASSADGATSVSLIDSSYLVEPTPGLWLLMLDANVFEPRNGEWQITQKKAFIDSSDAGWNSVLRNKEYLLDWIKVICQRADEQKKQLLAFSHYPTIATCHDPMDAHRKLFGNNEFSRRQPGNQVATYLKKLGLQVHFSGHMHVSSVQSIDSENRQGSKHPHFTNIALPSPVAYPPGYAIVELEPDTCKVDIVSLESMPLDPLLMDFYRAECRANEAVTDSALNAETLGDFLYQRQYSRVVSRHLKKDWPTDIAKAVIATDTADLLYFLLAQRDSKIPLRYNESTSVEALLDLTQFTNLLGHHRLDIQFFRDCSMLDLIVDWYCLRDGNYAAKSFLVDRNLQVYRFLSAQFGEESTKTLTTHAEFFSSFLGLMHQFLITLDECRNSVLIPLRGTNKQTQP